MVQETGVHATKYVTGDVLVWEDACQHEVVHLASSPADRVVLSIKLPHPEVCRTTDN